MCIPKDRGGMGFRDLHMFNTMMLAKQCWRLMEQPDSLCARVLHAKYYPDGDLLNSKLKSGSSYTWKSVLYGIQIFNRGCIWRVGDGSQIDIWNDPWIPMSPTRKMYTSKGSIILGKVSDLINPTTMSWDEELIRDIFWSVDATRILEIPITPSSMEDFVAWHFTKTGFFQLDQPIMMNGTTNLVGIIPMQWILGNLKEHLSYYVLCV
jgi:hypothetical protein